jgi:hypothetical protein
VDLVDPPQWPNKHLLSPWVDGKRKELEMMLHLRAIVDRMITLCKDGLEACHCVEEFILQ